jgi:enoyl-CoA hydratase/carnithine racemase
MATDKMIAQKDGAIGRIIFNNPERRNAVSLEMWVALGDMVADYVSDDAVRVIVLEGAGDKAFVAGADISRFGNERSSEADVERYGAAVSVATELLYDAAKPTIAKIRGFCIGGGLGIALSCDMRICSDDSQFAVPAAKLGLGYPHSNLRKLTDVVGPAFAKEIFFTARRFSADEAAAMGLVNRVVPAAELDDFVANYAGLIGANAPLTIRQIKGTVGELMKDAADRDLAQCDQWVKDCFNSADYAEGQAAFMAKRRPEFNGS